MKPPQIGTIKLIYPADNVRSISLPDGKHSELNTPTSQHRILFSIVLCQLTLLLQVLTQTVGKKETTK
jgi:hypothetical protein